MFLLFTYCISICFNKLLYLFPIFQAKCKEIDGSRLFHSALCPCTFRLSGDMCYISQYFLHASYHNHFYSNNLKYKMYEFFRSLYFKAVSSSVRSCCSFQETLENHIAYFIIMFNIVAVLLGKMFLLSMGYFSFFEVRLYEILKCLVY